MAIEPNWFKPADRRSPDSPSCTSRSSATGRQRRAASSRSSGLPFVDRAALRAVLASSPLPPASRAIRGPAPRPPGGVRMKRIARLHAAPRWPLLLALAGRAAAAQAPGARPDPAARRGHRVTIRDGAGRRLAVAVPPLLRARRGAALQSKVVDPFTATPALGPRVLGRSSSSPIRRYYPAGSRDPSTVGDRRTVARRPARRSSSTRAARSTGDEVSVEARVWDLKSRKLIIGRRYSGGVELRRADRPHARERHREVLHRQARDLPLDDRSSCPTHGAEPRRSTRWTSTAATSAQLTTHKSLAINPDARAGKVVYTNYVRLYPADLDHEPGRERQEGGPDGRGAERVSVPLARRHARSPSRARRRETPTSTRSAPAADRCGA